MIRRHSKTELKDSSDDLFAFDFIIYRNDRHIDHIGVLRCEARAPRTEKQQQHN
jgi:hypothetical protein